MSKYTVTVLTPNGRRQNVQCNPNTTILQILEEVCKKHGFKPDEYNLKHHKNVLDLSNTFRFSGLPNNALLEMLESETRRQESDVTIGLQMEDGRRLLGTFEPTASLLQVISELVTTECEPSLPPVIIYAQREIYGEQALQSITLKDLGLTSGRAVIRLIYRSPDQLKTQANVSSSLPSKKKNSDQDLPYKSKHMCLQSLAPISSTAEPVQDITEDNSGVSKLDEMDIGDVTGTLDVNMEVEESKANTVTNSYSSAWKGEKMSANNSSSVNKDNILKQEDNRERQAELEKEAKIIGDRNAVAFIHNGHQTDDLNDLPEDFYDLSVDEVKKIYKELQKQRSEYENTPLLTATLRSLEDDKRTLMQLHKYKNVVVRVQFPDRMVIQGIFVPTDTIGTVEDFIRNYLANSAINFYLFTAPPKTILTLEKSLLDLNLVPCSKMYFGSESAITENKYLNMTVYNNVSSLGSATALAAKYRHSTGKYIETCSESSLDITDDPGPSAPSTSSKKDSQTPKWLKTGH